MLLNRFIEFDVSLTQVKLNWILLDLENVVDLEGKYNSLIHLFDLIFF